MRKRGFVWLLDKKNLCENYGLPGENDADSYYSVRLPRIGPLCRVLRRTDRRVCVEIMKRAVPSTYSERILAEGARPEDYERMVRAVIGQRAVNQMEKEIALIRKRHAARVTQYEDELREALSEPSKASKPTH